MADLVVRPAPGQDVLIYAPTGYRFDAVSPTGGAPLWRSTPHDRARVMGAVAANPSHGHPTPPPPDPEPEPEPEPPPAAGQGEILISKAELFALPTSGTAWNALVASANSSGPVNLGDQNDGNDVRLLAAALVAVRTGGSTAAVASRVQAAMGTEGASTLALGRNLHSLVLAADLISYRAPAFVSWLDGVRDVDIAGRTLVSTHEDRPNNWGTHAGASRIAADLYLGDHADLDKAVKVFRGWLGDRSQYAGFDWSSPMTWHLNESLPVGINPMGATKNGNNIDGVLPDDQRRAGGYAWPPPKENYVYEALQGALMQAELLYRAGHPAYGWSNAAVLRAYRWLYDVCQFPASGDDSWQPWIVNARYGTTFPAPPPPNSIGKNFGYADWLYGG